MGLHDDPSARRRAAVPRLVGVLWAASLVVGLGALALALAPAGRGPAVAPAGARRSAPASPLAPVVTLPPVPANAVVAGPAAGPDGPLSARALVAADLPAASPLVGPPGPAARSALGTRTVDLRDFRPDPDDAGPALRRALDSVDPATPLRVYLPSGSWRVRTPLLVDRAVEIEGESPGSCTVDAADYINPFWVQDRGALVPADRRDAFGVLDLACCPVPGAAQGLALGPTTFHLVPCYPPSSSPYEALPGLTLSICFGGPPATGPICGLGDAAGPSPWLLECSPEPALGGRRVFRLHLATAGRAPPRELVFGDADLVGPGGHLRLDVQVRFDRAGPDGLCEALAWQQGRPAAVLRWWGTRLAVATPGEPSFTPADAVRLAPNALATFKLASGVMADNTTQGAGGQYVAYGLSIASDRAFVTDASGAQARPDGTAVDDRYRYLHAGRDPAELVARMAIEPRLDADPATLRWFSGTRTGSVAGRGYQLGGKATAVKGVTFRNLSVTLRGHGGAAFLLGQSLGVTFDRCGASGGDYGVSTLASGAVYDVVMTGVCSFSGEKAWVRAIDTILDCDGLTRAYVPGVAILLSGCDARFGAIRTGDVTGPLGRVVDVRAKTDYAGWYEFRYISIDQEVGAPVTAVYAEKPAPGCRLLLGVVGGGMRGAGVPVVRLADPTPGSGVPAVCRVYGGVAGLPPLVLPEGDWQVQGVP